MATYKYADWTFGRVEALLNIIGEDNAVALLRGQLNLNFERVNLSLDCSRPFNITQLLDKGWQAVEEDCDTRANELVQVDFAQASYETCLQEGESVIKGEEKFCRLKTREAKIIRHGGQQFFALWEDYQQRGEHSVLEHLRRTHGITYVDFMGLVLRSPFGCRCVLFLYWGSGCWRWCCHWLDYDWFRHRLSVVSPAS